MKISNRVRFAAKRIFAALMSCGLLLSFAACAAEDGTSEQSSDSLLNTDTELTAPVVTDEVSNTETEPSDPPAAKPQKPTGEKIMDIYLIAGQSNASGHTYISDEQALYNESISLYLGYTNVHYSGNARSDNNLNNVKPWGRLKLGLGFTSSHMGPEAGIAEALSSYYNASSGKHAGIIKMAHGGSSVFNVTSGNNQYGNWVSPTYARELNIEYTGATGGLYRALLDQVKTSLSQLKGYGYTGVNIKGMYWMQGETDRENPVEYKRVFQIFVNDLRNDLSAVLKEYTGTNDDCGASDMPIFVGTICESFYLQSTNGDTTVNKTFIEMQKTLPEVVENCYVVDNSQYAMTIVQDNGTIITIDDRSGAGHWNQTNAFTIGKNVGAAMLASFAE